MMNMMVPHAAAMPAASYDETRFNALQHGVLSRYAVLPWEDRGEYEVLLSALVAEHAPRGPTEEHLVEELAGVVWRKRRLRIAEGAIYRDKLRKDAVSGFEPEQISGAALLPVIGSRKVKADIPKALSATAADIARELRDAKRDRAMTTKALNILTTGGADAYARALSALGEDTSSYWLECLDDPPTDGLRYQATADALAAWIQRHWAEWYEEPIVELEHRDAIREQAIGVAYASQRLEVTARYEVHLDRKLERTLSMLLRLRDLRQPVVTP